MINLNDYGEMIMKQEFHISAKTGKAIDVLYLGKNTIYDTGYISIEISNIPETENYKYVVSSNHKGIRTITSPKLLSLNSIYSLVDNMYDTKTPVNVFRYDNSKKIDQDTYSVCINDIELYIDKSRKIYVDNDYFAHEFEITNNDKSITSDYAFFDYGIHCIDSNKERMYLLNTHISPSDTTNNIKLSNIYENQSVSSEIPNLNLIPLHIEFCNNDTIINKFDIDVDEYGLPIDGDNTLYECYYLNEYGDIPMFAASIHPYLYDNFDLSLIGGADKFALDYVNVSLDDDDNRIIEYVREVYNIPDKVDSLITDITEAKQKNEPCIYID